MNKPLKVLSTVALTLAISLTATQGIEASSNKVMWGKTELKLGQIGKVTILKDTNLFKLNSDGTLKNVRKLNQGDEFRVYQYKGQHGGLYGVGSSSFVQKDTARVLYETPSKSKLELVKNPVDVNKIVIPPVNGNKVKPDNETVLYKNGLSDETKNFIESNATKITAEDDSLIVKYPGNPRTLGVIANSEDGVILIFTPLEAKSNSLYTESAHLIFKDLGYKVDLKLINNFVSDYSKGNPSEKKVGDGVYMKVSGGGVGLYTK